MNFLILQTLTLLASTIWFDKLPFRKRLKLRAGHLPEDHVKPYDCYTCTNWWFGVLIALVYGITYLLLFGFVPSECILVLTFVGMNYMIGSTIDHIKY